MAYNEVENISQKYIFHSGILLYTTIDESITILSPFHDYMILSATNEVVASSSQVGYICSNIETMHLGM